MDAPLPAVTEATATRVRWALPRLGRVDRLLAVTSVLAAAFALALLPRLVGVDGYLTSDEGYWMQRTAQFSAALQRHDWARTYRSGHPGVTVMWTGVLGMPSSRLDPLASAVTARTSELQKVPGYREAIALARRAMTVVSALLFTLAVGLAWKLLGPGPGLLGGVLVLLDPYLIGSSQVFHVDTLLAPLMTVGVLAGLVYWTREARWPYLLLSAVACGLAMLTKAPAICAPLFVGLVGLVAWRPRRDGRRGVAALVAWGLLVGLVYVLLWPALWVDPIGRLRQVVSFVVSVGSAHNWPNFFNGRAITDDPGPLYYPVALAFRLSPLVILGLVALTGLGRRSGVPRAPLLWMAAYVLIFVGLMTVGGKKFDRYMLPAIVVLDVMAGAALWAILTRLRSANLTAIGCAAVVALQAALLIRSYPYPIAYYNPLLDGARGAERTIMVGWGEGLEQVAAYLNRQPNADQLVAATHYHYVLRPLFRGTTIRIVAPTAPDYFVVYVNMAQRRLVPPPILRAMAAGPPEFTAHVNGREYAWVYRVPAGEPWPAFVPNLDDEGE